MQFWLAGAGEAQLADAVALNAKLQGEVDQLNDTVFSKTFRAPSAWAEREVKYKMDKKAWDSQVGHFSFTYVVGYSTCCFAHKVPDTFHDINISFSARWPCFHCLQYHTFR